MAASDSSPMVLCSSRCRGDDVVKRANINGCSCWPMSAFCLPRAKKYLFDNHLEHATVGRYTM